MTRLLLAACVTLIAACGATNTDFYAYEAQGGSAGALQGGSASGGRAEAGSAGMVSSAGAGQGGLSGAGSGGQAGEPSTGAGSGGEAGEATGGAGEGGQGGSPDVEPPPLPDPCVDTPVGGSTFDCDGVCGEPSDSYWCGCNRGTEGWTAPEATMTMVLLLDNERDSNCLYCIDHSFTFMVSSFSCARARVLKGTDAGLALEDLALCGGHEPEEWSTCIVATSEQQTDTPHIVMSPGNGPTWLEITSEDFGPGGECSLTCL